MPNDISRFWKSLSLCVLIVPLALSLTPAQGISQDKDKLKEAFRQAFQQQKPQRPKVGRNLVEALQAGKKYATFLAIAGRAGMMPLLEGKSTDTTKSKITLIEDSVQTTDITSSSIQIQGDLPADINATQLKSDIADQMRDAMGDLMMSIVAEEGRITVFAPTDAAFAKLSKARLDSLKTDSVAAAEFVRAHLVNRGIYRDAFAKIRAMTPLAGPELVVGAKTEAIATINSVTLLEADLAADNGVAHGIEGILDPRAKPKNASPASK